MNTADQASEQKTKSSQFRKHLLITLSFSVILFSVAIFGLYIYKLRNHSILTTYSSKVNFAIYYADPLPSGYTLDKKTVRLANGIIFYTLKDSKNTISISEQQLPPNPPDFNNLKATNSNFQTFDTPSGSVIAGTSSDIPVAIILTNTTLINISGTNKVPLDSIRTVSQNMHSLPQ